MGYVNRNAFNFAHTHWWIVAPREQTSTQTLRANRVGRTITGDAPRLEKWSHASTDGISCVGSVSAHQLNCFFGIVSPVLSA